VVVAIIGAGVGFELPALGDVSPTLARFFSDKSPFLFRKMN
jgi:hypothetical protein